MSPPPIAQPPTATSSDSQFIPRREFLREDRVQSSFSILTLSGSSFIRAYSFAPSAVTALRRYLEYSQRVIGNSEDAAHDFYEFTVPGKPWSNSKSVHAEKLLVGLLTVLYKNSYVFLSTIDYGREQDDRIVMAFSRPVLSAIPQSSPSSSAFPGASNHSLSQPARVPFAISFPNATTLRVISPPLHSTPAILKTVRDSWPRGVVSEKIPGDCVYEFKLKGYKWFQEDTFATDSLRHILALLGSLDAYGFTLLTSLSLTNRSRVKDLWIFTGASESSDSPAETPLSSPTPKSELKRSRTFEGIPHNVGAKPAPGDTFSRSQGHIRTTSDTATNHRGRPAPLLSHHPAILRKPAPRAQLPVSVAISNMSQDGFQHVDLPPSQRRPSDERVRATLASTVGSAVDMTGVGTRKYHHHHPSAEDYPEHTAPPGHSAHPGHPPLPGHPSPSVFYAATPDTHNPYFPSIPGHDHVPAESTTVTNLGPIPSPLAHPPAQAHTHQDTTQSLPRAQSHPPLAPHRNHHSSSSGEPESTASGNSSALHSKKHSPTHSHAAGTRTPPLLSPTAFRDSAFSSGTEQTCEIPITWTGSEQEKAEPKIVTTGDEMDVRGHNLPGGWISPVEEKVREEAEQDVAVAHSRSPRSQGKTSISTRDYAEFRPRPHDMHPEQHRVKVGAPEIVRPRVHPERKSEAAVVSDAPHHHHKERREPVPLPHRTSHEKERAYTPPATGDGQGWVMVNVGGTNTPSSQVPPSTPSSNARTPPHSRDGPPPVEHHLRHTTSPSTASISRSPPKPQSPGQQSSMSPAAKAIVIIDAVEARNANKKKEASQSSSGSGLRRIFSLSRSSSMKGKVRKSPPVATNGEVAGPSKESLNQDDKKLGIRERWRRIATPEASKSSRRMSVD